MNRSRRAFVQTCGLLGAASFLPRVWAASPTAPRRSFHFSTSCDALEADPELLEAVIRAGVTDVWLAAAWSGRWFSTPDKLATWRERIAARGLACHIINVPLGHPDAGSTIWPPGVRPDGSTYTGTSLHDPATQENCQAVQDLYNLGVRRLFLDDDFRLAQSPGTIGGCFCPAHKREFLQRTGFGETQWSDLLADVQGRRLTPLLKAWVEFTCDQLTRCFRAQQKLASDLQLGIMVMYLGAEKAGIRLPDYAGLPMRVGELMFDDGGFDRTKGKTDELFSSLFHRRFVTPELAFSETTAYPVNSLSLANKVAKLAVSTLSDVRNTMFMCDFPRDHWATLGPAMKKHASLHAVVAGHTPRGPLKHFWGEASRYVSDDNPYSLFLALGVPFEVTDAPASDGFTFLSDADALLAGQLPKTDTQWIGRAQAGVPENVQVLPESLPEMWAWKRALLPQLERTPYVEDDKPVVCAWYPTAQAVLLWNLSPEPQQLSLRCGAAQRAIHLDRLELGLVENVIV